MKNNLIEGFTSSIKRQYEPVVVEGNNSTKRIKVSGMGINSDFKDRKPGTVKRDRSHYKQR